MNLLLQRLPSDPTWTHGDLFIEGTLECCALEDRVREIPDVPVASWKIPGETAIPAGKYRITLENSPRFGFDTITLHDVPGFAYIRMHAGNTDKDTEGCILVGTDRRNNMVVNSRVALSALRAKTRAALNRNEEIWIEIKNAAPRGSDT